MSARRIFLALSVMATSTLAHADTFKIEGAGVNDIFTLSASPSVSTSGSYGFTLTPVSIDENGTNVERQIVFFDRSAGGGMLIEGSSGPDVNDIGSVLYMGANSQPTFLTGTFTFGGLNPDVVTISSSAVTPEPTSIVLVLLGTFAICTFRKGNAFLR